MNTMLAFLGVCLVLGLWTRPKSKLTRLVLGITVLLIAFYLVVPRYL